MCDIAIWDVVNELPPGSSAAVACRARRLPGLVFSSGPASATRNFDQRRDRPVARHHGQYRSRSRDSDRKRVEGIGIQPTPAAAMFSGKIYLPQHMTAVASDWDVAPLYITEIMVPGVGRMARTTGDRTTCTVVVQHAAQAGVTWWNLPTARVQDETKPWAACSTSK